ncbi:MAG: hypothetical protein VX269_06315 [Verrucomicrobiota bacterium]|jgi:hypothetical protein|nr:hypothetical protein [Verrucomicrobiota bacterium]
MPSVPSQYASFTNDDNQIAKNLRLVFSISLAKASRSLIGFEDLGPAKVLSLFLGS